MAVTFNAADGFTPFGNFLSEQEEEQGWLMKSGIPRKKRSGRIRMFKQQSRLEDSNLHLLSSVAEETLKQSKKTLNLVEKEAMQLKKTMIEEVSVLGESRFEILVSVASKLRELNERLPPKKRKLEFSSLTEEIPKQSKKRSLNSKVNRATPMEKKKKKKKTVMVKPAILSVPAMPEAMVEKIRGMGGQRVKLVIQKQLRETDINTGNSRLSIPCRQTKVDFLSQSEKVILGQSLENKKGVRGIDVLVIDPRLEELSLCLKRWKMTKTFVYNLIGNWNQLVAENKLEVGDTVQLWVFRVEERRRNDASDLCFALVKVEEEDNNGGGGGGSPVDDSSTSTVTTHDED